MKFAKMHGTGNDFVLLDCSLNLVEEPALLARKICDRHKGVGADGMILLYPSLKADGRMEIFNPDGSKAEMCGNGIRCLAGYLWKQGEKKPVLKIDTAAGIKEVTCILAEENRWVVCVNMGIPQLQADKIPVITSKVQMIQESLMAGKQQVFVTAVSMGNPHAVLFVENLQDYPVEEVGPLVEYHGRFLRRTNVEFVEVDTRNKIAVRVWERGVGETLSCGTGACAATVACILNHLTERQVSVQLKEEVLTVEWRHSDNSVYLTGSAEYVFDGEMI